MPRKKPQIFIASSSEGLNIAYAVQEALEQDAECTVWNQGIFEPSSYTLPDLLERLDITDFGIFVFSVDDTVKIRDKEERTVRDNVILELGLFMGALGQKNCFILMPRTKEKVHLPTDLAGMTLLKYIANRDDENIIAAIGPTANRIRNAINKVGIANRHLSPDIIEQINTMGFSAFYSSREDYSKYRKDASSIDRYIARAKKSIIMVSISLTTGLSFDDICNVMKQKLQSRRDFSITISLLNPFMDELYMTIAPLFNQTAESLKTSTKEALTGLKKFRDMLEPDEQKRFIIKVHNTLPFGSAIILDGDLDGGTIQIETKPYKVGMRKSFAFEISNNNGEFYDTIKTSYYNLIQDGKTYNEVE